MLEITHPRIGHQHLAAAAEELIQQRQVGAVVEHVGDDDQVEAVGLGEEILRITQRHPIERRIGTAGLQRQRVEVAGHHFGRAGPGRRDGRHTRAGTEIQHALAASPFGVFGQPARQHQAAGPAETPIGRLLENPPGFLGAEGAIHVGRVDQPQSKVGAWQGCDAQAGIAQQFAERAFEGYRCVHGAGTSRSGPSAWLAGL